MNLKTYHPIQGTGIQSNPTFLISCVMSNRMKGGRGSFDLREIEADIFISTLFRKTNFCGAFSKWNWIGDVASVHEKKFKF